MFSLICAAVLFFVSIIAYLVYRFIQERELIDRLEDKAIVVTGCDTGFGRAMALKAATAGMTVFAGCLTDKGVSDMKSDATGLPLIPMKLDVTSDESVQEARKLVASKLGRKKLWALVNNAGIFSIYGPADWCTIDEYQLSLNVNTLGPIRVTKAFVDLLKESRGRIVNTSSVAGRVALPIMSPYNVAKFGVEAYSDVIRRELKAFGVTVHIIEPGGFKATSLLDHTAMEKRVEHVWKKMSEEKRKEYGEEYKNRMVREWNESMERSGSSKIEYVVDNYYHAVTAVHPRKRYQCGWDAILFWYPVSFLPTPLQDALIENLYYAKDSNHPASLKGKKIN